MSVFGNIGNAIKKGVVDVGHFAGKVASNPLVDAGIGAFFGPGAAAAAGGLGRLIAPGGNLGEGVKGAAIGGAAGFGGQALKGALASHNIGGALSAGGSLLGKALGGAGGALGGLAGGAGALASGALGGGSGGGMGGGGMNPAILALAGLQMGNAASLGKKANDYSDHAWNLANDSYQQRSGLRDQGIQGLMHQQGPDLSGLAAIRAQNPVAAQAQPPQSKLAQAIGGTMPVLRDGGLG